MGFGFGGKKGNARRRLGAGVKAVKPVDRDGRRRLARGEVMPIDRPIKPVGSRVRGTSGTAGRVGRPVKSINRRTRGADDIFDPMK